MNSAKDSAAKLTVDANTIKKIFEDLHTVGDTPSGVGVGGGKCNTKKCKKGGFIKSQSTMPQHFYEFDKSC